jgi:hypothetical protein
MTVDEAIQALIAARKQVGGNAPLVMADWLGVRIRVSQEGACVYATDVDDAGDELGAAGLPEA